MPEVTAPDGVKLHWEERGSGPAVLLSSVLVDAPVDLRSDRGGAAPRTSASSASTSGAPASPSASGRTTWQRASRTSRLCARRPARSRWRSAWSTRRTARCGSPSARPDLLRLRLLHRLRAVRRRARFGTPTRCSPPRPSSAPISSSSRPTTAAPIRAALAGANTGPLRGRGPGARPDPDGVHRRRGRGRARSRVGDGRRGRGARAADRRAASASACPTTMGGPGSWFPSGGRDGAGRPRGLSRGPGPLDRATGSSPLPRRWRRSEGVAVAAVARPATYHRSR